VSRTLYSIVSSLTVLLIPALPRNTKVRFPAPPALPLKLALFALLFRTGPVFHRKVSFISLCPSI
jgi:hypothetical protein